MSDEGDHICGVLDNLHNTIQRARSSSSRAARDFHARSLRNANVAQSKEARGGDARARLHRDNQVVLIGGSNTAPAAALDTRRW